MPAGSVERADVLVVGAGPAGAAAAIALRRFDPTRRVVLLDRAAFPRDKTCGDAVAAHAFEELARLGVTGVEADAPPVWELRLRTPDGSVVVGRGDRPNRVIPRAVFDARLVERAVAAGAELHRHRVRQVELAQGPAGGEVVVDGRWAAPWVIAADGATSVVRRRLGIPPPGDRHRALAGRAYAPAGDGQDWQRIDVGGVGWPAYAWSFPIGDGRANVGYGVRVDALGPHGRRAVVDHLADAADHPADPGTVALAPIPLSTGRPRPDHGRVLLAGDAAGLVNPLTGEGIFYAIASGRMAAIAIHRAGRAEPAGGHRGGPCTLYRRMLRRRFGRHLATTSALARALDLPAVLPIAAAAARDPRAYLDLAEIGLGEGAMTRRLVVAVLREAVREARSHLDPRS